MRGFLCLVRLRCLADPQIPVGQQAHLLGRVALGDHAIDEIGVLLLLVGAGLGVEADHRQQVLGVGKHLLLDHRAQLFVTGPGRITPGVVGPRPQHEVDDLVAEVFRVADTGRFLDLLQFGVERGPIERLAGVGIAVFLVLNPEVGVGDVAVENVLPVLGVGLQVGLLKFLADELGVTRRQVALEVG
jgi:hypothetical protein